MENFNPKRMNKTKKKQPKVAPVERLRGVGIKRDGVVYEGTRSGHLSLRQTMGDLTPSIGKPGDIDGFITSAGKFVDRQEARDVAIGAGQISEMWKNARRELLSSDINW